MFSNISPDDYIAEKLEMNNYGEPWALLRYLGIELKYKLRFS